MQKANPKSTVAPKVHCLNFGMNLLSIQVFHRCRVHQVDCGDLIHCSWGCWEKFPFLFFVHTSPGVQLWFGPASACRSPEGIFWEVWGLLLVFSRCSVGVVPHVDVVLMYLWGGRWSPRLTPPPSWRHLLLFAFNFTLQLKYICHITLGKFKVYSMLIWYVYIL